MANLISVSLRRANGVTSCSFEWQGDMDIAGANSVSWVVVLTASGGRRAHFGYKLVDGKFSAKYAWRPDEEPVQTNYPDGARWGEQALYFAVPMTVAEAVGAGEVAVRGVLNINGVDVSEVNG